MSGPSDRGNAAGTSASTSGLDSAMDDDAKDGDPRFPQNYFQRSSAGRLRDLRRVRAAASHTAAPPTFEAGSLGGIAGRSDEIREAARDEAAGAAMKVRREVLLYDPQVFDRDVLDAFRDNYGAALEQHKLDGVDVTVEVFNKPAYVTSLMVVVITAAASASASESAGSAGDPDAALDALFPSQLFRASQQSLLLADPTDIRRMKTPMGDRQRAFNLPSREFGGTLRAPHDLGGFFAWLKAAVRSASWQETPNLQAHFRLAEDDGAVYANVVVFEGEEEAGFPPLPPTGLVELDFRRTGAAAAARVARAAAGAAPRAAKIRKVEEPKFPMLEYLQVGHPQYEESRGQYASYRESYHDTLFMPFRIARPATVDDVVEAVRFALRNNKRVVTRSGGHQYCGFSSGDEGYVQIDMDSFLRGKEGKENGMELSTEPADAVKARGCSVVSPDGQGRQHFVSVLPRCRLRDVSAVLYQNSLTIPHGECPLVGIGGHVQTGGYGHQMRGLGLCLDYVYSFDIVVCTASTSGGGRADDDGAAPDVRKVTVYRPELKLSDDEAPGKDHELNDDLYKGVLGGSPGAFGVITRIKFLAVHDEDPAFVQSTNVQKVYPYQGEFVRAGAAQVVRTMLRLASRPSPKLCDGLDVFVTILSFKIANLFEWGIVIPELAYTGPEFTAEVKKQMDEVLDACGTKAIPGTRILPLGQALEGRRPSVVAHKGVRTDGGGVTGLGREFDHPYKKRVNVMLDTDRLSESDAEAFSQGFGKLAAEAVLDPDLLLVVQMNLGGGQASRYGESGRTGIPYRNQSFGFVFDVFYTSEKAKPRAKAIQDEMQSLLDRVSGGCFNHRLFWGSFGREYGETDMSQAKVQQWYYGTTNAAYKSMQAIKDRVDPYGVFTTEFTVQNS